VNYLLYLLSLKFVFTLQISETILKQNIPVIRYIEDYQFRKMPNLSLDMANPMFTTPPLLMETANPLITMPPSLMEMANPLITPPCY